MPTAVARTTGLVKVFGRGERQVRALDGVDLEVSAGSVTCLLGHNGSGKSTVVRILTTAARPTEGRAEVCGLDAVAEPTRVRRCLSVTAQESTLDARLSGRENLVVLARLLGADGAGARDRAAQLLGEYDLDDAAARPVATWSGGMRRRLDLAASLIGSPRLLVLDEPTTGLDPHSRATIWAAVRALTGSGTSVLLTTQNLDEADHLADHVVVLQRGRVVADESPEQLRRRTGRRLEITVTSAGPGTAPGAVAVALATLGIDGVGPVAPVRGGPSDGLVRIAARVPPTERDLTLPTVLGALARAGTAVHDIGLHEPTLDEAYLALIGAHRD